MDHPGDVNHIRIDPPPNDLEAPTPLTKSESLSISPPEKFDGSEPESLQAEAEAEALGLSQWMFVVVALVLSIFMVRSGSFVDSAVLFRWLISRHRLRWIK